MKKKKKGKEKITQEWKNTKKKKKTRKTEM